MKLRSAFFLTLAWLLAGCSNVYAPEPLGDAPVILGDAWSGTWNAGDNVLTTSVIDREQGVLLVAWLESKPGGIETEEFRVELRSKGGLVFGNIKDDESDHGYIWLLVDKKSDQRAVVWSPDTAAFEKAVSDGKLPGTVLFGQDGKSKGVVLGELEPGQLERIADPTSGLLNWKDPLVLLRISE